MDGVKLEGRSGRAAAGLLVVGLVAGIAAGCGREDADCLGRIGQKSLARAEALTVPTSDRLAAGWQALRAAGEDTPLDQRVLARLRWDKELAGVEIAVQLVGSAVELRGKVRSAEQRQRATELAQATTGVETVKDALEVVDPEP